MEKGPLAGHPNIELYYYGNPLINFYKVQDNLHDKVLLVYRNYLITGGRNASDSFFVDDEDTVFDLDILVKRKNDKSSIDDYKDYYEKLLDLKAVKRVANKSKYSENLDENIQRLQKLAKDIAYKEDNIYDKLNFRDVNLYFVHNKIGQFVKDPLVFNHIGHLAKKSNHMYWISPYIVFSKPIQKALDIKNWTASSNFITNNSMATPNFFAFSATYHYADKLNEYAELCFCLLFQ